MGASLKASDHLRLYDVKHFRLEIYLVGLEFHQHVFLDGKLLVVIDREKNIQVETTLRAYMKTNHPTQKTYSMLLYYDKKMDDYLPLSIWIEISKKRRRTLPISSNHIKKQLSFHELMTTPFSCIRLTNVSIQQFISALMFYFKLDQCHILMEVSAKDICYFTTYRALYHFCAKMWDVRQVIPPIQIILEPHIEPPPALKYSPLEYSVEAWPDRHQYIVHVTGCRGFNSWRSDIMEIYYCFVPRICNKSSTASSTGPNKTLCTKSSGSEVVFTSNYAKYDHHNLFGKK